MLSKQQKQKKKLFDFNNSKKRNYIYTSFEKDIEAKDINNRIFNIDNCYAKHFC